MSNTSWIERYVMPAALRIAGQKHVLSVRDGIILNMPFMLIGSFFLIFAYLPIPAMRYDEQPVWRGLAR